MPDGSAMRPSAGKLVRIKVEYDETGLFVATSPDMPNLFVAESSEEALIHEIPQIIEALYELQGIRVVAYELDKTQDMSLPSWAAVPQHVAKARLSCS